MHKWSAHLAISAMAALILTIPPMQAQLPTFSDVGPASETRAAGPLPEWDVASVKPHLADDHNMSWRMNADGLSLVNLSLELMICSAWNLKPYQLSGLSGWMKSSTFDLTAKVSADDIAAYKKLSVVQRGAMLQKLLVERFQLKVHMETKTLPIYDLVVDKSGSKLKPSTAIDPPSPEEESTHPDKYKKGYTSMGPGMYEGTGVAVKSLASQLANVVGKPVHDTTGLTGLYDIHLNFRSEETTADNSDAPSIFSAVQEQLGLKLLSGKGPVEILVMDTAQKPEPN